MSIKTNNMKNFNNDFNDFENSGLELIDKPIIYVPRYLEDLMEDINIQKQVNMGDEFSLYAIAKIDGFVIRLTQEYFIPTQTVHSAETDNCENRPNERYNCVIHRHPDSCNNFSAGDNTYINRNFDVSLLWTASDGFVKGRFNMYAKKKRLALDCEIIIQRPPIKVKGINKIKKFVTKSPDYFLEDVRYRSRDWQEKSNYNATLFDTTPPTSKNNIKQDDSLLGSQVIDNSGNLIEYDDVMYRDNDSEWYEEAIEYIESLQLTNRDKKDIDMRSFELLKELDTYEDNYCQIHSSLSHEFQLIMYILAFAEHYLKWTKHYTKTKASEFASKWVDESYDSVHTRTKFIFETVKNNIKLKLKCQNSKS